MERKDFCIRLSQLRMKKGISSRDMSLSLGLSAAYINNIENNVSMPSMDAFFLICDFLEITPKEFFDMDQSAPNLMNELEEKASNLNPFQLELIIKLIEEIAKS